MAQLTKEEIFALLDEAVQDHIDNPQILEIPKPDPKEIITIIDIIEDLGMKKHDDIKKKDIEDYVEEKGYVDDLILVSNPDADENDVKVKYKTYKGFKIKFKSA